MKKTILALAMVLALFLCAPVAAQDPVLSLQGALYLQTVPVPTTDTSQKFTAAFATAYGTAVDWSQVKAVLITCETNAARLAFGTTAVNSGTVVGHVLASGSSVRFASRNQIQNLNIISNAAGSAAVLQCTLEK